MSNKYALFLKEVEEEKGNIIYKKGSKYPVLDEDRSNYYILYGEEAFKTAEFPKEVEGSVFIID